MKTILTALFLTLFACYTFAQSPFAGYEHKFTPPLSYVVGYASIAPNIDGDIYDEVWNKAAWTSYFQDIEGDLKPKPSHNTWVKMLWDEKYLYFAIDIEEPHVWAKLTKRDEIVFYDNDFEIFINPDNTTHNYFEVEINAFNTIFDLYLNRPYRSAGSRADHHWDTPGMLHAVKIQGTINDPSDSDTGWTAEFAIPHSALTRDGSIPHPTPKDGDIWRLNFSRVQWKTEIENGQYVKAKDANGKELPENNWVWSPQGVIDMHRPERWGYLQFSTLKSAVQMPAFELPYTEKQKKYLWLVFYKQSDFRQKNKRYATTLKELGMDNMKVDIDGKSNKLTLKATQKEYVISIADNEGNTIAVDDTRLVR